MQTKKGEMYVGLFIIIALCSIAFFYLKIIDISLINDTKTYRISASFDNIGGLKVHSPVKIGGVVIGRVIDITLDSKTYIPIVTIEIKQAYNHIPNNSSLSIRTSGLLGEQYLALNIGFDDPEMGSSILRNGDVIHDTNSSLIIEDLIGQLLYKSNAINNINMNK